MNTENLHKLLQRQLRRATRDGALDFEALLALVSQAYHDSDVDREREQRASQLMSSELISANEQFRRKVEQRLEEAYGQLSLAIEASDVGLWTWDLTTDRVEVSAKFRSILGFRSEDEFKAFLRDGGIPGLLHPDDSKITLEKFYGLRNGVAFEHECRLRRRDGVYRWIRGMGRPFFNNAEKKYQAAGTIVDITDRRQVDENLANAVEAMNEGFALFDSEDRLQIWNRRYVAAFPHLNQMLRKGMSFEEIAKFAGRYAEFENGEEGRAAWVKMRVAQHRNPGAPFEQMLAGGRVLRTIERRTANGGTVLTVQDISDEREQQRRLGEAKERAEAADRSKSEFLAVMSHEIRTPLNGVIGMLRAMSDAGITGEAAEWLRVAKQSADLLYAIVEDVLDFSKLEAGKLDLDPIDFDLLVVLEEIVSIMNPRAVQQGSEIQLQIAEGCSRWLYADGGRLRQILVNLIGNAVKFTKDGRIDVSVATEITEGGRILLRCAVADTGIGIAADKLPRLFEKFNQGDASTTRRFGGTGLGLAICKRLVEQMQGSIEVESSPGKGSVFRFEITCDPGSASAEIDATDAEEITRIDRSLRILVAEDNATNQMVIRLLIEGGGHRCVIVSDGVQAVEALQDDEFDIVLMDVEMPEMDGPTATRLIRQMEKPVSDIPIIALTANAFVSQREAYLKAGMTDYVSKPIDPVRLAKVIARHCSAGNAFVLPALNDTSKAPETSENAAGAEELEALLRSLEGLESSIAEAGKLSRS